MNRRHTLLPVVLAALVAALSCPANDAALPGLIPDLERFARLLIAHGRDDYGPEKTPLFVSQLDITTGHIPPAETTLYGPDDRGGAGPVTNNLQFDAGLIRLFDALSQVTGDNTYRNAIDAYLAYYLKNLPDPATGFFPWGDHRGYDLVRDTTIQAHHEFKVVYPPWERMYAVNAAAVRRALDSLPLHLYDESRSWAFSRHYPTDDPIPHSMCSSGGAYIAAWAFMYTKTGEQKYISWARNLANYFWSVRNPDTDLLASHPYDPAYPEMAQNERARRRATRTEYMEQYALFAPNLLIAAGLLGKEEGALFRDQAMAYLRAFTTRMDPQDDGAFYATFKLDTGEPLFPRIQGGWHYVNQEDTFSYWENSVLGLRAPLTAAFAAKTTGAPDFIAFFDRVLPLYELESFSEGAPRRELPAGLVAQAIGSFLDMYAATDRAPYLEAALTLGRYARKYYFVDGWIVCGPPLLERYQDARIDPWKLYSNRGGSPELGLALLRAQRVATGASDFIEPNPLSYF